MLRPLLRKSLLIGGMLLAGCAPTTGEGSGPTAATGGAPRTGTGGATGGATVSPPAGGGIGGARVSVTTGVSAPPPATGGATAATGGASTPAPTGGKSGGTGGATVVPVGGSTAMDPGSDGDGDFSAGPTYALASDLTSKGNPQGKTFSLSLSSSSSKIFTGMDATLKAPTTFTRKIDVYIPAKYKDGTPAPLMVVQDGGGTPFVLIKTALDNLTIEADPARRLPPFVAIALSSGGGDGKGSERGLEYDTMSDKYARYIDTEILPAIASNAAIKAAYPNFSFTKDPEGRGAAGCSSGAAAAFTMVWLAPNLFRKAIAYSATLVAQQADNAPEKAMYPDGAWDYHSDLSLIANTTPNLPVRIFHNANEMDNGYTNPESGKHNWLMANQRTAAAFKAKGYHYRFVLGKGLGHCDQPVQRATMGDALLWLWRGYPSGP